MSKEYDRGVQDRKDGKDPTPPPSGAGVAVLLDAILPRSGSTQEACVDYLRGYEDGEE